MYFEIGFNRIKTKLVTFSQRPTITLNAQLAARVFMLKEVGT